ncbi:hypothetical protein BKA93DRAFT_824253 [Sparassis latifolia]
MPGYKGKDRAKLFSAKCQKEHWPFHKTICKQHQERVSHIASLDDQVLSKASTSTISDESAVLLPSELTDEMRSFMNKFGPALFQAGFNCMDIANHPMGWTQVVCYVILERFSSISPTSRPWSRFRVLEAEPFPLVALHLQWNPEQVKDFIERKQAQERHHQESGFLGSITIVLSCRHMDSDPPLVVHNTSFHGFGSHSKAELEISDDWRDKLKETVERMCGRGAFGYLETSETSEVSEPSGESYLTYPD